MDWKRFICHSGLSSSFFYNKANEKFAVCLFQNQITYKFLKNICVIFLFFSAFLFGEAGKNFSEKWEKKKKVKKNVSFQTIFSFTQRKYIWLMTLYYSSPWKYSALNYPPPFFNVNSERIRTFYSKNLVFGDVSFSSHEKLKAGWNVFEIYVFQTHKFLETKAVCRKDLFS